ncbi:DUF3344 domain-containing protein [Streptomyces sioyaensis]|uniref:DUF3344 domain-containing protein n=1 Tax=Streptomyces sioyaensis TaxID=67364 RepID=A0A4Q1RAH7_9ACTN|nr:DUF3344 domain-containing protein [Streptomyces sioyaensis]MBM4791393.1 DUF3344 domain-containing protein [Streptomyces sioyaensis]RXS70422.1 DUF3344 domain-containing protein [Streptomyces sioyaensis]
MRKSMDRTGRGVVCALASLALSAALSSAAAAPAPRKSAGIPFTERYHVTQHGGIARAANSSAVCRAAAGRTGGPCAAARQDGARRMGHHGTAYPDVDSDARTDSSSRATLRLPAGSRVSYARLYWGGTLRAGTRKAAGNNGRMLVAGPGGRYRTVRADTVAGHRGRAAADGFQASADVTGLVRRSGPGAYTVARTKGAKSPSAAGGWGGWTLVAVYENAKEPLRRIALWDGFQQLAADRRAFTVRLNGLHIPVNSQGRAGVVAYDGYRDRGNDALTVRAGRHHPLKVHDSANPANDVMNSTITDFGRPAARRPAYRNTLGFDSDVFDITPALRSGADRLTFRFTTRNPGYLLGALFVQADTRH